MMAVRDERTGCTRTPRYSGLYLFEVVGNPKPGQAAYMVDRETVSAGGIGNVRIGVFAEREVTIADVDEGAPPIAFLRFVHVEQETTWLTGPLAGTIDPWSVRR
jgi:hypothetical protein